MTTMTSATTDFYVAEAVEVYAEEFDFTVVHSAEPLPCLLKVLRSVGAHVLTTAVAAAFTGMLTFSAGIQAIAVSEPNAVAGQVEPSGSPNVITMTAQMRQQAALASKLFTRTPHPGADDPEPDYGF